MEHEEVVSFGMTGRKVLDVQAMKADVAAWCPPSLIEMDYSSPEVTLSRVVVERVWRGTFHWTRIHLPCMFVQMVRYAGMSSLWLRDVVGLPEWEQECRKVEKRGVRRFVGEGWVDKIVWSLERRKGARIPLSESQLNALAACRARDVPLVLSQAVINGFCLPSGGGVVVSA